MNRVSRGVRLSLLLGAGALLPAPALGHSAAAQASPDGQFDPPAAPMILTRTLRRPLPDGNEVLTRRSYEIRFLRETDGFRVEGELVSAEVEAPADLAALAAIERARPDAGMFPMRLDPAGTLQPMPASPASPQVRQASAQGRRLLDAAALAPVERAEAQGFVRQVEEGGARSQWPRDLFRPDTGYHRDDRVIALPGGGSGNVAVETEAASYATGLLASFSRTVTTDLGGNTRRTYELWTLAPKPEN